MTAAGHATAPRWPVVLFDFDGTLGDTIALIVASYRHALSSVAGLEVDDTAVRSWIGRPLLGVLQERHPEHAEAMVEAYRAWNLAHHDTLIRPVPGMVELLDALAEAGAQTTVVSSKVTETVRLGLAALGLDERLPQVVGQGDTEHHKPHPAPLLLAARRLGSEPGDCVYVGDATVDVLAARAAGMAAVAVTWGAGERDDLVAAGADAVVEDVAELATTLGVELTSGWSAP